MMSMNERERAVAQAADEVLAEWAGHIGTHSPTCWKRHVACFARLVKDRLEGEGEEDRPSPTIA